MRLKIISKILEEYGETISKKQYYFAKLAKRTTIKAAVFELALKNIK